MRNNTFTTSERGQPLSKGQKGLILYCHQVGILSEVSLYCRSPS